MGRTSYADYVRHWGELSAILQANPELAHLEPHRATLEAELEGLKQASILQATYRRQSQEASRKLDGHVTRGKDLATRLRDGIRGFYGRTDEMLVEFRLQPRRSRATPKAPGPEPETEKPSEMGANPAQTATPVTDGSIQEV